MIESADLRRDTYGARRADHGPPALRAFFVNETVNTALDREIGALDFQGAHVYFVLGHPRSDIGKGELVARLAFIAGRAASIIKFDGLLNTNVNGQHPSQTDDFATYRRFNPSIGMGGPHQILGGELLQSFIAAYGGSNDHLCFVPHVSKYAVVEIHRRWCAIGRPASLFVEIGGTTDDLEVSTYLAAAIAVFRQVVPNTRLFLLDELTWSCDVIKTKSVQQGLRSGMQLGLHYDALFLRLPEKGGNPDDAELLQSYVRRKLSNALVHAGQVPPFVLVPHYGDRDMAGYLDILVKHRSVILVS